MRLLIEGINKLPKKSKHLALALSDNNLGENVDTMKFLGKV